MALILLIDNPGSNNLRVIHSTARHNQDSGSHASLLPVLSSFYLPRHNKALQVGRYAPLSLKSLVRQTECFSDCSRDSRHDWTTRAAPKHRHFGRAIFRQSSATFSGFFYFRAHSWFPTVIRHHSVEPIDYRYQAVDLLCLHRRPTVRQVVESICPHIFYKFFICHLCLPKISAVRDFLSAVR